MADISDIRSEFELISNEVLNRKRVEKGGGGDDNGGMDDLARRVGNLETKMDKVQDTLTVIQVTLARMEATMATKAEVSALGTRTAVLEERTQKLASTRGVAGMLALATAALALISRWSDLIGYFTNHH